MGLPELAARIRAEHEASVGAFKRSIEHAIAAGSALLDAKAQLRHGEFMPWLKEHCCIPYRSAAQYMRLAKNRQIIETQNCSAANLSQRAALDILTRNLPDFDEVGAALFGTGLMGESLEPKRQGNLAQDFLIPPFSVLDARSAWWQGRKRAWIALA